MYSQTWIYEKFSGRYIFFSVIIVSHTFMYIVQFSFFSIGIVENNYQETQLLKQKYLESKAKRSKKPEKKPPSHLQDPIGPGLHNSGGIPVSVQACSFNCLSKKINALIVR